MRPATSLPPEGRRRWIVTKKQSGLLAVVSCALAFSSAAALAYGISRPLSVPARPELGQLEERGPSALVASTPEPGDIIEVAPIVVVGHFTPHAAERTELHPTARDLRDMRCTGWRPLEQGSVAQSVRLCE
jgi:hypothetical protein